MDGPAALARAFGHPLAFATVAPLLHVGLALLVAQATVGGLERAILILGMRPVSPPPTLGGVVALLLYAAVAFIAPLVHLVACGGTVWIKNRAEVDVEVPHRVAKTFIRDARNLAYYEQKVVGCRVSGESATGCRFTIWGFWFGLPFTKSFWLRFRADGGFHSTLDKTGFGGLPDVVALHGGGGFVLRPRGPRRTNVLHYERYGWPLSMPLVLLFAGPWRKWHLRGMEVEMELIREQMEKLNAVDGDGAAGKSCVADFFEDRGRVFADKYGAWDFVRGAGLTELVAGAP